MTTNFTNHTNGRFVPSSEERMRGGFAVCLIVAFLAGSCGPSRPPRDGESEYRGQIPFLPISGSDSFCLKDAVVEVRERNPDEATNAELWRLVRHFGFCAEDQAATERIMTVLANRNDPQALYELALMRGFGSPRETAEARELNRRALSLGYKP